MNKKHWDDCIAADPVGYHAYKVQRDIGRTRGELLEADFRDWSYGQLQAAKRKYDAEGEK